MYEFKTKSVNPVAFDQTTTWYDRAGKSYKISQMNYRHVVNTIKYLNEHYLEDVAKNPPLLRALHNRALKLRKEAETN